MSLKKYILALGTVVLFTSDNAVAQSDNGIDMQQIEASLIAQEEKMTPAQKETWEIIKGFDSYKKMTHLFKKRLMLDKIRKNERFMYIPTNAGETIMIKNNGVARLMKGKVDLQKDMIPTYPSKKEYDKVSNLYVLRNTPNNPNLTPEQNVEVGAIYEGVNKTIHSANLMTLPKWDMQKLGGGDYAGSFINLSFVFYNGNQGALTNEEKVKLPVLESPIVFGVNTVLGRTLSLEEIVAIKGNNLYCVTFEKPLEIFGLDKQTYSLLGVAHVTTLSDKEQQEIVQATEEAYKEVVVGTFKYLPQQIQALPLYKENATARTELDGAILQIKSLETILLESKALDGKIEPSLAHKGVFIKILQKNMRSPIGKNLMNIRGVILKEKATRTK